MYRLDFRSILSQGVGSNIGAHNYGESVSASGETVNGVTIWVDPQRGPRAAPWSGSETESFFAFGRPIKAAEFAVSTVSGVRICDVGLSTN